jgi:hypothetical protein
VNGTFPATVGLVLALGAASIPSPATGATYIVDDGASIPQESTALLRWRQAAPSRSNDNTMDGALSVVVRLKLAPWIDRPGRVFLALPEQGITTPVKVSWTTHGRLLPGTLTPGNRVLVFAGPITTPVLEETLTLQIEADGSRLIGTQRLKFRFEIDLD